MTEWKPTEKDIEDEFIKWITQQPRFRYLGRQITLPLGVLDVLLFDNDLGSLYPIVVEVKRDNADDHTITQVMGYTYQIKFLLTEYFAHKYNFVTWLYDIVVRPIIVAKGLSGNLAKRAHRAQLFRLITFSIIDKTISFEEEYGFLDDKLFAEEKFKLMSDIVQENTHIIEPLANHILDCMRFLQGMGSWPPHDILKFIQQQENRNK